MVSSTGSSSVVYDSEVASRIANQSNLSEESTEKNCCSRCFSRISQCFSALWSSEKVNHNGSVTSADDEKSSLLDQAAQATAKAGTGALRTLGDAIIDRSTQGLAASAKTASTAYLPGGSSLMGPSVDGSAAKLNTGLKNSLKPGLDYSTNTGAELIARGAKGAAKSVTGSTQSLKEMIMGSPKED